MPAEQLKKTLKRVHEELGKSQQIDDDLRSMLRELDRDIDRVLADEAPSGMDEEETMSERVEVLASRFSAEYPRLELLLREVSDTLAKLGI